METFDKDILVSVIVPVYNASKYISETLLSLENQDFKSFEVFFINDCSNDTVQLLKILNPVIKRNSNFKYFEFTSNQGVAVARNFGMSKSRSRYICFLDSDDVWNSKKLSTQVDFMLKNDFAFSFTNINFIDNKSKRYRSFLSNPTKVSFNSLLISTPISTSSVMFDRNSIKDYEMPLLRSGQDYAAWLKYLKQTPFAYNVNQNLVDYRLRKNSLSKNKLDTLAQIFLIQTKYFSINKFKVIINLIMFLFHSFVKKVNSLIYLK
jgi:teichuronic acid biosynthesis glycosyltransferase TuaG